MSRRQWISEPDRAVWHVYTTDLEEAVCGHPNNGDGPPSDRPDPDDKVCGGCFALLWRDLCNAESNTAAAHALLDKAGVPAAKGQPCADPACISHLTHRLHMMIAARDERHNAVVGMLAEDLAALTTLRRSTTPEAMQILAVLRELDAAALRDIYNISPSSDAPLDVAVTAFLALP